MRTILITSLTLLLLSSGGVRAQNQPEVVVEPAVFTEQALDQMLAPIALYPDSVLAHILIAATYPLEVVQAARWTENHPGLEGDDALQAVEEEDWDPSVKALVAFPDLLVRMSEDLDWTERLGNAFLDNEERVTERVQYLRQRAYDEGTLNDLEHLDVVREEETIIIEPAVREVVYVPYYDTRYVYGPWWWDSYPPIYWRHPHHHYASHYYTGFYWGPRVHISAGFFFSGFHWHNHHVVVIDHYHYRHNRYYSSRQIVRHRDARRWHHNPRHRRGVDYHNPRTRDYFERRKRNDAVNARYDNSDRSSSRTNVVGSRDLDQRGQSLRYDKSRRNADYVRDRLDNSANNANARLRPDTEVKRGERTSRLSAERDKSQSHNNRVRIQREQSTQAKRDASQRGNVKLQSNDSSVESSSRSDYQSRQFDSKQRVMRSNRNKASTVQRSQRSKASPVQRTQRSESRSSDKASSPRRSSSVKQRSSGRGDRGSSSSQRSRFQRER